MCLYYCIKKWSYFRMLLLNICVEIADMYLGVIGDSCSIMSNDYELTMAYDMIVSLCKGWFQIDRYDCLDIWNMWLTCVSSCKVTCLELVWQGEVTSMLLHLLMHRKLYIYGSMMQRIAWKNRFPWNIKEGSSWTFTWRYYELWGLSHGVYC